MLNVFNIPPLLFIFFNKKIASESKSLKHI